MFLFCKVKYKSKHNKLGIPKMDFTYYVTKEAFCYQGSCDISNFNSVASSRLKINNVAPISKVGQLGVMKKNSSFVIYKSFEELSLNNFQVIIFERMAKNCFKENILSNICWNICFSMKKIIYLFPIISIKELLWLF